MFNLYVEPMWQDERYVAMKRADKRVRRVRFLKLQEEAERKVIVMSPKP